KHFAIGRERHRQHRICCLQSGNLLVQDQVPQFDGTVLASGGKQFPVRGESDSPASGFGSGGDWEFTILAQAPEVAPFKAAPIFRKLIVAPAKAIVFLLDLPWPVPLEQFTHALEVSPFPCLLRHTHIGYIEQRLCLDYHLSFPGLPAKRIISLLL